jgi:hypothetical protein
MELHESLYALGRSQGRELFNDADSFRGALDDYLDEDSATTGDINLLVDAVRLGAFQGMMSMLDSGADADRAVSEAGGRLARDRGSADVGGAMWALAVLGYATGKVSDAQVRRYRTQHASAPAPPPTGPATVLPPPAPGSAPAPPTGPSAPPPPGPSAPQPAPTQPVWPSSGGTPNVPGSAPAPAASYGAPPPSSYGSSGYGHAAPRKKRKAWPFVLIGAVVLVLVVGGGIFALTQLGDDDKPTDPEASSGGPTTTEPEGPDVSFEALNSRYQSLASIVTSGMDSCEAASAQSGQTERVSCSFPRGTLVLTTYSSVNELEAARQRRLNLAEGTIVSDVDSGAYYRFDPTTADPESTAPPIIYWDSQAGVQSAELTGATGVTADQLDPAFVAVSATVTPPDGPVDIAVKDFNTLFDIINCQRIPTEIDGETEESKCKRSGRNTWVGKFDKVGDLRNYRSNAKQLTNGDGDLVVDYWYNDDNSNGQQDSDEPEQGKIYGYIEETDGGTNYGVLYIDDLDCRCYLQMYDKGQGDPEKLYNLIF